MTKKASKKLITISLICMIAMMNVFAIGLNVVRASETNTEQESSSLSRFNSDAQIKINVTQAIEKYFPVDETQTLLQQNLIVKTETDSVEKESEKVQIEVPIIQEKKPELAIVLVNGEKLKEDSYDYQAEEGKLEINLSQKDKNNNFGKIEENYQIIYGYQGITVKEKENIQWKATVETKIKDQEMITTEDAKEVELVPMGEKISVQAQITKEIYKGYLYQGTQRETNYQENVIIEISNMQNVEKIDIGTEKEVFIDTNNQENPMNQSTYFKASMIVKDNMLKLLSEDGTITIKNEKDEVIQEISKNTEADENGNIIIKYENDMVKQLKITTSKPVELGKLVMYHKKAIQANTGYQKDKIKDFTGLKEVIKVNEATSEMQMNLLDTSLQTKFEIDRNTLSTMTENKEVEIKATLKNNDNTQTLYKNPIIQMTMPEEVEKISLVDSVSLWYEEELKVANVSIDGRVITVLLEGEQTKYKEEAIEGAVIGLKVNLTLNKKATSAQKEIVMTVQNNKKDKTQIKEAIEIVSPRELITVNKIEQLGVETIGEEKDTTISLEKNKNEKEIEVTSQIISNQEETIKNIKVMGVIPTDGTVKKEEKTIQNNLGIKVNKPITVKGKEAKIYYTQNENATDDITKQENAWTENNEEIVTANKYLIIIDEMNKNDTVDVSYVATIPSNLEYNQQAYEGYEVTYTKQQEQPENTVKSTYINLATGQGPVIEGRITASIGGETVESGSLVKTGEVIRYQIEVRNTGTEDATDIKVISNIPEGAVFVQPEEQFEYTSKTYYEEIEKETNEETISELKVGETKTIEYEIRVRNGTESGVVLNTKAQIQYGEVSKESNEFSNVVEKGDLRITYKRVSDGRNIITPYATVEYFVIVENFSNQDVKDAKLELNVSDLANLIRLEIVSSTGKLEEIETAKNVKIGDIEANGGKIIRVITQMKEFKDKKLELITSAKVTDYEGKQYRSNGFTDPVYGFDLELSLKANDENGYMKSGDTIEYVMKVINNSIVETNITTIINEIPKELTVLKVEMDGEEFVVENNTFAVNRLLKANHTYEIKIQTVVNYSEARTEDVEITDVGKLQINGVTYLEEKVSHILQKEKNSPIDPEEPDNPDNPDDPDVPDEPGENDLFIIRGKAWLDENKDGEMQNEEAAFDGIQVRLLDVKTNSLVKDSSGNVIKSTTDTNGNYEFNSIKKGKYIVIFEYDASHYTLSPYKKSGISEGRNSDALSKKMTIENEEKTYGVTDAVEITDRSLGNVNIGLIKAEEFDLKLDKYVTQVTVQGTKSTQVYSYGDVALAKVELDAKKINQTNIMIAYKIKVTNVGQIEGYAKQIIDYLPEGFTFDAKQNKQWYEKESKLYTTALTNEKIGVGESKEITLIISKAMTQDETGTYRNVAEIAESYNDLGVTDINSIAGNKKEGENDMGTAEVIVSIRTGKMVLYITLTFIIIAIVGLGIYLIKKKVLEDKK